MKNFDLVIIGGGPAGISAALYAKRAGVSVGVIHSGKGSLWKAEKIDNYYGFPGSINGTKLYQDGIEQARTLGIEVVEDEVVGIGYMGTYQVKGKTNEYESRALLIATGSKRTVPKIENFTDFEGKGVSYCAVCDGFFYRGKSVAVLGSGDYARAEAEELKNIATSVTILTNGEQPSADFSEFTVVIDKITSIKGDERLGEVVFENGNTLPLSGLFVAIGVAGATDFAKKLGAVTKGAYIVTDESGRTNLPGLFAAGDCTGGLLQVSIAVSKGASAGLASVEFLRKK
ncbi:MAG TPA: NAD(P)/FAD-dependent oxidoreductase [Oscillospiraceae bacterium]|nr:NAD(P)/FAD-dependent oxidoreductase [Oscillospiraceae bacterium]HPF55460.1 NAD(P)/FAD-dependent oxidoreductase [Clostridiales bacterium]HPK34294.1 NAD(P)/FAD-dependent oxidoreductase [Oscillospiraceae bacterium]HPR74803.1 NAD(P)/FAD-dependent oxidoreductase [Oscillospiraceae bacterium]